MHYKVTVNVFFQQPDEASEGSQYSPSIISGLSVSINWVKNFTHSIKSAYFPNFSNNFDYSGI